MTDRKDPWMNGHESGYLDAVAEFWTIASRAYDAGAMERWKVVTDLANDVRARRQFHADSYPAA